MKILFVCRGNVGRSQISEALFKKMTGDNYDVLSAGTKLSGPEGPIGALSPAIDNLLNAMREKDIEMSGNIRKQVTNEMAASADRIILVVDDRDPLPDYLVNNPKAIRWDVLDPKDQSLEFHRKVRDQIQAHVEALIPTL